MAMGKVNSLPFLKLLPTYFRGWTFWIVGEVERSIHVTAVVDLETPKYYTNSLNATKHHHTLDFKLYSLDTKILQCNLLILKLVIL